MPSHLFSLFLTSNPLLNLHISLVLPVLLYVGVSNIYVCSSIVILASLYISSLETIWKLNVLVSETVSVPTVSVAVTTRERSPVLVGVTVNIKFDILVVNPDVVPIV